MTYGESNGHVNEDVTWQWKVKLMTLIFLEPNISKKQLEMLLSNNRWLLPSLLWGSMVGYPSDSLASPTTPFALLTCAEDAWAVDKVGLVIVFINYYCLRMGRTWPCRKASKQFIYLSWRLLRHMFFSTLNTRQGKETLTRTPAEITIHRSLRYTNAVSLIGDDTWGSES